MNVSLCAMLLAGLILSPGSAILQGIGESEVEASAEEADEPQPAPVDESMHHFMEYIYEPRFAQLKAALAEPIADKAGWKPVKEASLTLAEGANLLLLRAPEKSRENWQTLSSAVRDEGSKLYQAARSSQFVTARAHYEAMIQSCNACHQAFAMGKHQLEP